MSRGGWSFGPTTLNLLLIGTLLTIPIWFDRRAAVLLVAWNAVVVAAWMLDLRRLPRPSALTVTRTWRTPLALGTPADVHLEVENAGSVALRVEATDMPDASLRDTLAPLTATVPPQRSVMLSYRVTPRVRGDVEMGAIGLRYRSAAGLAERWAKVPARQSVRIYPDIQEGRRQSLALIRARQLALEKRRAIVHGLGRDFESLREFQDGDELRDVCWTATARRGRLITRTYRPERSQAVWLVLDAGRLMRARSGDRTRLDHAVNAAFALAQVAATAGDRVGLLAYGRQVQQRLMPGRGAPHLRAILEALAMIRPEPAEADHVRAATNVLAIQKQRSLVVWLTEIAETVGVPEVVETASRLVTRHVVLYALVRHSEVLDAAAQVPSDAPEMYRVMAAQEVAERRAVLLGQLRERGALTVEVPPDGLAASIVDRYLEVKQRNLV